jgi:uncharacterized protein YfaS (alpha-2-macroglobulin family)
VAAALSKNASLQVRDYATPDYSFGSAMRDQALMLQSLVTLNRLDRSSDLVRALSAKLASDDWYSTQSVAYSLMAMARFAGSGSPAVYTFERRVGTEKATTVSSAAALYQAQFNDMPVAGLPVFLRNTSQRVLFATVSTRGVPAAGVDQASAAGLSMDVSYTDETGKPVDVGKLNQGSDIIAKVSVRNLTPLRIDNIALTQIVPAGWEIHNDRLDNTAGTGDRDTGGSQQDANDIPDGSRTATQARADYVDIRDDRVLQYFGLKSGETIRFTTRLNAAYLGRFYLPSVSAEAMYDASKHARSKGQWVQVVGRSR